MNSFNDESYPYFYIFIFLYFIKLTFKHHENQTNYTLLIL